MVILAHYRWIKQKQQENEKLMKRVERAFIEGSMTEEEFRHHYDVYLKAKATYNVMARAIKRSV